ncbi:MAG: NADPH-dependent FMN reductase [Streptosporangiaceae bacterium]
MNVAIVVGNPKPRSRTWQAAQLVAEKIAGRPADLSVDLVDFGAALLDWQDQQVAQTIKDVAASDLLVVASPTYKATYTGLLKLFLDRIAGGGLAGVTAVPLMLGGDWRHSLAADMLLKPVLVELGATCPTRGLFLTDSDYAQSPVLDAWLEASRPQLTALLG